MTEEEIAAAAMNAEGGNGTPPAQPPVIDYAKLFEEQKAQNVIMQHQINQSLAIQQQLAANQNQNNQHVNTPPPADPYAAFEPETAKAMRAVADGLRADFNNQLGQTKAQLAQAQLEAATAGVQPAIAERARVIFAGMSKQNIPLTPADSVRFAIGEAMQNGTYTPSANTTRQAPPVLSGGSRQPVIKSTLPANFETLSRIEQNRALANAGVENEEF